MNDKLLRIYLNDHLSGETAVRELAKRCLSNNRGSGLGDYLQTFLGELDADISALEEAIRRVGAIDRVKQAAGWTAEKIGRLKLNGQLTGYSPLSRLLELEGLKLGVGGKLSLWKSLRHWSASDTRFATMDFDHLIRRAEQQSDQLETYRLEAVERAFA